MRTILYPLIKPYVVTSLLAQPVDVERDAMYQSTLRQHIHSVPSHIHKTLLLEDLARELDLLRKDLAKQLCKPLSALSLILVNYSCKQLSECGLLVAYTLSHSYTIPDLHYHMFPVFT